jgi:hypothetical protein
MAEENLSNTSEEIFNEEITQEMSEELDKIIKEEENTPVEKLLKKERTPPTKYTSSRVLDLTPISPELFNKAIKFGAIIDISKFSCCIKYWWNEELNTLEIWSNREANINIMENLIFNNLETIIENRHFKFSMENKKKSVQKKIKNNV